MYNRDTLTPTIRDELVQGILLSGCIPGHLERVLLRLLWFANEEGHVWLKERELAQMVRLTPRALREAVKGLATYGVEHQRPIRPQAHEPGVYRVTLSTIRMVCVSEAPVFYPGMKRARTLERRYGHRLGLTAREAKAMGLAYDGRPQLRETEAVRDHDCPYCGAAKGQRCHDATGRVVASHSWRYLNEPSLLHALKFTYRGSGFKLKEIPRTVAELDYLLGWWKQYGVPK